MRGTGADRAMGLFINTLPVRILIGEEGVEGECAADARHLAELLRHEHASLALAQRCSSGTGACAVVHFIIKLPHTVQKLERLHRRTSCGRLKG